MSDPKDLLKSQLDEILKIDNEEVNPYGKPFKELLEHEKEKVKINLDAVPEKKVRLAKANARGNKSRELRAKGKATVVHLGKFNQKTAKLLEDKAKELGYKYPSSIINDAVEDFLGIPRGSSMSESMTKLGK